MEHNSVSHFLGMLVVILVMAKLAGAVAQRLGQPSVLGELLGGVLAGPSLLGWVDPHHEALQLLAEVGVLILLFAIGIETDVAQLWKVGVTSLTVATAGVVLPFVLGYGACRLLGLNDLRSIMAAATLTATSVGITARVLSDLGRLQEPEGRIIIGAAVIDDILGLLFLTIVDGMTQGQQISMTTMAATTARAFGFLIVALAVGRFLVPWLFRLAERIELPGTVTVLALATAFAMAWLAERCGSAMIIGSFAAGLLVGEIPDLEEIERGITALGHFFVPIFFVMVGTSVDLGALNPLEPASRFALLTGGVLIVVGIIGKLLAGYTPFWFRGNKTVIGVGMIPRGEVGLIFARMGLDSGVFDSGLFGAATIMVMITTLVAPPLLKFLLDSSPAQGGTAVDREPIEDLVTGA